MKNILFGLGYSEYSKTYFRYAQIVAKHFNAKITLVHVYEQPGSSLVLEGKLSDGSYLRSIIEEGGEKSKIESDQRKRMKDFIAEMEIPEFDSVKLELLITAGEVEPTINELMATDNYDLLVLGMRKHSFSERIFGSKTHDLMDTIKKTILLIPPAALYSNISKIVYATAFDLEHVLDLKKLEHWRNTFDASLEVVYVDEHDDAELASKNLKRLISHAAFKESDKLSTKVLSGSVAEALRDYVKSSDSDLLAIHRKSRGFWSELRSKSITKEFIEEMTVPILVFKS